MKLISILSRILLIAGLTFTAQAEDKKPMPGVTDTEIKIGSTAPKSGPAAFYELIFNTLEAYLKEVNDKGGVKGRKIVLEVLDDAYNPAKTVEQTKVLVERDNVSFIFASLGTATGLSVRKYLNDMKIPQIMLSTGFPGFSDHKDFPWTTPGLLTYDVEAMAYADYILKNKPDAKIAVLYQNDGYGQSYLEALKKGLGDKADKMIVAAQSFEVTDPSVKSQMLKLKASGATVLLTAATPKQAIQAMQEIISSDWKPLHFLCLPAAMKNVVFKAVGYENSKGVITGTFLKDVTSPKWEGDADVIEFKKFLTNTFGSDVDPNNFMYQAGFVTGKALVKLLELCGDDLSRENIMKNASNFSYAAPLMMPGIEYKVSPDDFRPFKSLYLVQFDGNSWVQLGDKYTISTLEAEKAPATEKK